LQYLLSRKIPMVNPETITRGLGDVNMIERAKGRQKVKRSNSWMLQLRSHIFNLIAEAGKQDNTLLLSCMQSS
jgi:hypothetical protein